MTGTGLPPGMVDRLGFDLPPVPFVGLFALHSPIGDSDVELLRAADCSVKVLTGPLSFQVSVPVRMVAPGAAGMTVDEEMKHFRPGRYLLIETEMPFAAPFSSLELATLRIAEVAASVELCFPGILAEKLYEGVVAMPGMSVLAPPSPITVRAQPDTAPDQIMAALAQAESSLAKLSSADRERFRLASRWYTRGVAAENLVDRLLYWFVALEVHPARGTRKVPSAVRDYLHMHVYPSMSPALIKQRSEIGHFASSRGRIVHKGLSFVDSVTDRAFGSRIELLGALVRVCLCVLAGIPHGGQLDRWMDPPPSGAQA